MGLPIVIIHVHNPSTIQESWLEKNTDSTVMNQLGDLQGV